MLAALPLALLLRAPAFVTLVGAPYAIDATRTPSMRRPSLRDGVEGSPRPTRELHTGRDAFWFALAWFMMCCAWSSRAWGCAAACTSRAASQKAMRGCPSGAKRRRRRRRKSRTGSMAAAAPRRCKWAAMRPQNRSAELEISENCTGFRRRGPETRPGGVARPSLRSRKVPRAGRRGTHLSKASLKPWRQLAVTITDRCP